VRFQLYHLGYPLYFAYILGVWLIGGAAVIIAPGFPRLKEWAYAGSFFQFSGAVASHLLAGDGVRTWVAPLVFSMFVIVSWGLRPDDRRAAECGARAGNPPSGLGRSDRDPPSSACRFVPYAARRTAAVLPRRTAMMSSHEARPRFRARYPQVRLEPNVLYVDEGRVLTSAGSAAGIDLCLHVVRCDYGAEIANLVARRLVVPPHRDGGQSQYVPEPVSTRRTGGLAPVLEWALARLDQPLGLDDLARQASMSVRTLARRFLQETGSTPHRWLTHQRLLAAQRRLETTDDSIDAVAEAVGFDTAMTLRHHFRRAYGTTPTAYRRRFSVRRLA
jgi:AraC-like DNA-binding protein